MPDAPRMMPQWWGRFELELDQTACWQIGPFSMWVLRARSEWRIGILRASDAVDGSLVVEVPSDRMEPPAGSTVQRFGFGRSPAVLHLRPALADRAVVVAPDAPFFLPPRQEIVLYVSLPLWIEVFLGKGEDPLLDVPIFRPSDTWFGASTQTGELCYAARTSARLVRENLSVLPHRATSEIRVRNNAKSVLTVERLKIPTGQMSLHSGADARLWTDTVTLERKTDNGEATVGLESGPPAGAAASTRVRPPRNPGNRGFSIPAFSEMLWLGG
jgi:hypothetical protein